MWGIFYGGQNYKFTARYEIACGRDRLKISLKIDMLSMIISVQPSKSGIGFYDKAQQSVWDFRVIQLINS